MKRWRWTHVRHDGTPNDWANNDHKAERDPGFAIESCRHCGGRIAKETW